MFKTYNSLPRKIEAVQFTNENKDMVRNELTGRFSASFEDGKPILCVETTSGNSAIVRLGDWIVKENSIGFYYPVKNDIFGASYE